MRQRGYRPYAGRRKRPWLTALVCLLALGIAAFAALEAYIGLHSVTRIEGTPQTMVIFGCQVKPWGPSVLLQDRLDTALSYLENDPEMKIVVTGGKGDDEHQSEAQCMYDYLTAHGVDGEQILMEDQSRNTWQNINCTRKLLSSEEGTEWATGRYLLVSNGFHLSRIQMLWARGWQGTYTVSTLAAPTSHVPSAVKMFFREPLALVKSFVFDR